MRLKNRFSCFRETPAAQRRRPQGAPGAQRRGNGGRVRKVVKSRVALRRSFIFGFSLVKIQRFFSPEKPKMAPFRVLQAHIPTRSDRDRIGFSPSDLETCVIIVCSRAIRCVRAQRRESIRVIYTPRVAGCRRRCLAIAPHALTRLTPLAALRCSGHGDALNKS